MKRVRIYSVLSNNDNETTTVEAIAEFDEKEKVLKYTEENLKVEISIFDKRIVMKRKNDEYDLNLEFILDEKKRCRYNLKTLGLDLEIDVLTKTLEIENNRIYINYELFNDNKSIGEFEYKLLFME
jgi:uncharacterized beta-barrel protein YwiB (DUF1934 family)